MYKGRQSNQLRFQQPMIEKMIEKVKENLIETILDAYAPKSVTEIIIPLKKCIGTHFFP